jgi:hypothetical protein
MAFQQQQPRFFNRPNVEALRPNQFGVYGLFRKGQWVYVKKRCSLFSDGPGWFRSNAFLFPCGYYMK